MAGDQQNRADLLRQQAEVLLAEFEAIHGKPPMAQISDPGRVRRESNPEPPDANAQERGTREQAALALAQYYRSVHELPGGQAALCLSGGGIRSAAFCLGVLQGLARRQLLSKFHYLSTVSGGGYIGCWLTAWAHRAKKGGGAFAEVEKLVADRPPYAPAEVPPMHWLRRNQRFLTPRAGLMSADSWAGAALFIRDLVLNWTVFLPAILAFLLLPRLLELGLVWWTSWAPHSGSGFAWLLHLLPDPIPAWLGLGGRMDRPGWKGWTDVAGASVALFAMVGMVLFRRSGASCTLTDRGFIGWVLTPLIAAGLLIVLFNAVVLSGGVVPDRALLVLWAVGTPLTFVTARAIAPLIAWAWRWIQRSARDSLGAVLAVWRDRWARVGPGQPSQRPGPASEQHGPARETVIQSQEHGDRKASGRSGRGWLFVWDIVCHACAGAAVGTLIWLSLWLRSTGQWGGGTVQDLAVFGVPVLLIAFVAGQIVYAALACRAPFGQRDQEWMGRASGYFLLTATLWAVTCGIVIYGQPVREQLAGVLALMGVTGSFTVGMAVSAFTKANTALAAARQRLSVNVLVKAAALLFLLSAVVLLSAMDDWLVRLWSGVDLQWEGDELATVLNEFLRFSGYGLPAEWYLSNSWLAPVPIAVEAYNAVRGVFLSALVLLTISIILSCFVDVNLFSLHALYRNRLVRTFLGASNLHAVTGSSAQRNSFHDFSDRDDLPLDELWQSTGGKERNGPYPVINIAVNLVGSQDPAWQDRKAAPFVATPFQVGGALVGYMQHDRSANRRHLTLGDAMAISGAAASPNWGYHSSPLIGFIMMLFNVRLGWWFENPRRARPSSGLGLWTFLRFAGRSSWLFLQEALGLTRDNDSYLYLSDGGHFDNLGIYEMLRRRCSLIVAVDATQDQKVALDDLGRTLRQASIDLGVTVRFDQIPFQKRTDPASAGFYATVGDIAYPEGVREGKLIYIKPGFLSDVPADVRAYGAGDPNFPHDSTMNQWFTESQFESYRALGAHVMNRLYGPAATGNARLDLPRLPELVSDYLHPPSAKPAVAAAPIASYGVTWSVQPARP